MLGRHWCNLLWALVLVALVGVVRAEGDGAPPSAAGDLRQAGGKASGRAASVDDEAVIRRIDELVRAGWDAHKLRPAREASDAEWQRRVFLDLVGRIPTVDEQDAMGRGGSRGRRVELVDRLLGASYAEEYARNWATLWSNLLIGRTGGTQPRTVTSRAGMRDYLQTSFAANKPYHQMVRELVTATGATRPGMEGYNGAVNFLVEKLDEGGAQATAKTAQLFLGMSVQCTQCHNHPFNDYRQNQFWELSAFFRQTAVEAEAMRDSPRARDARLVDRDFAGEGKSGRDTRGEVFLELRDGKLVDRDAAEQAAAPIFYELRNGQVRVAYPAFVDGQTLAEKFAERGSEFGNSGRVAQVRRRAELADYLLASEQLDQAAVNRMWGHFFGYGFTRPVDDIGPHNPPSHPELLAELARAFRDLGYDLKRLMRWIVLSEAYGLSSRVTEGNRADDPTAGKAPQFSRFYLRQMEAEQLYESLIAATEADAGMKRFDREAMKAQWLRQFATSAGNDEGAESTTFNGSIPQVLTLMNGELVRRACTTDAGGFLDRVAHAPGLSDREKINYLYRAALGRLPGKDETRVCNELLAARYGDVVETLADVWWAVLNSNEFILVH